MENKETTFTILKTASKKDMEKLSKKYEKEIVPSLNKSMMETRDILRKLDPHLRAIALKEIIGFLLHTVEGSPIVTLGTLYEILYETSQSFNKRPEEFKVPKLDYAG
jgi:hypothetical protein